MPTAYTHLDRNAEKTMLVDMPVERTKPKEKKQKKFSKKAPQKPKETKQKGLKHPALLFWFSFIIICLSLMIASAFLIGLAVLPWSIALYLMMGANIAAITTLLFILFVDVPDFPDVMAFVTSTFVWAAVNFVIGLAFLIWGLAINWIFGWMIGLILLGIFVVFVATMLISMAGAAAKEKKLEKKQETD